MRQQMYQQVELKQTLQVLLEEPLLLAKLMQLDHHHLLHTTVLTAINYLLTA
jgi:hypothetical protein